MKSIDRAIFKVEEKLSQGGGELTNELQANLKCVLFLNLSFSNSFYFLS